MKILEYHSEAATELIEATAYYAQHAPIEVALDFDANVTVGIAEILQDPLRFPRWERTLARKYVVPRYPFIVFYLELPTQVRILAIAHTSRWPGYWKSRIAG